MCVATRLTSTKYKGSGPVYGVFMKDAGYELGGLWRGLGLSKIGIEAEVKRGRILSGPGKMDIP